MNTNNTTEKIVVHSEVITNTWSLSNSHVWLKVTPIVTITGPRRAVSVYALFDEGLMIDADLVEEIGVSSASNLLYLYGLSEMFCSDIRSQKIDVKIRGGADNRR